MVIPEYYIQTLTDLCNLPTAPYCEQFVISHVLEWAKHEDRKRFIKVKRDPAGNVHLRYTPGEKPAQRMPPLVIEAHLDHPGFVAMGTLPDGQLRAEFRGSVRPSLFTGGTAQFWINDDDRGSAGTDAPLSLAHPMDAMRIRPAKGHWVPVKVLEVQTGGPFLIVTLEAPPEPIPRGTLGMWALPDAQISGEIFAARVCDDLGGAAAVLCLLDELINHRVPTPVIGLLTRAEEVGFAGVLAVAQNGWIPKGSRVIGLETSKGSNFAPQGEGPIIRVGDRMGLFSAGLTYQVSQAAGHLSDNDSNFKYQRKLMDGGTCNSTAFCAFGYDATGMCVALGNYHNQSIEGECGYGDGAKAGPGIAAETIHLGDFAGMVRILLETARRIDTYKPGFGVVRERLEKLHRTEQHELLYGTSDQKTPGEKAAGA